MSDPDFDKVEQAEQYLSERCYEIEPVWVMRWKVGEENSQYLTSKELIELARNNGMGCDQEQE